MSRLIESDYQTERVRYLHPSEFVTLQYFLSSLALVQRATKSCVQLTVKLKI